MSNEFWRRCAVVAGKALLGMLLGLALYGCNGDQPVAGRLDNAPSIPSGGGGVTPPSTNPAGPFAIALPSQVFTKLRGVKQASSLLTHDASDYVSGFSQRVNKAAPSAIYSPVWESSYSPFGTVSYAIYRFDLTARTGKLGIHTLWTQGMADYTRLWIGASNWKKDRWDWSSGAATGIVDTGTAGMGLYKHPETNEMYVAVVVLGQSSALLRKVWLTCSLRGDWWMCGRNTTHHGCSPFIGPDSPALKWQCSLGNGVRAGQAVYDSDGAIYIGCLGGLGDFVLRALNPDGSPRWEKPLTALDITSGFTVPAIDDDGTIYYALHHGPLYAFKPDGTQKWMYSGEKCVDYSPAIGPDGTIYVLSFADDDYYDAYLHAVDRTGVQKWEYHLGSSSNTSPVIADNGAIYVVAADGELFAFSLDGAVSWTYKASGDIGSDLSVSPSGIVYFISREPKLYALNPDGTLLWSHQLPENIDGFGTSAPTIGPDGAIYIVCGDRKLYALNPDGSVRWSYYVASQECYPSVDANGCVYVSSGDSRLYALNPDGTLKWWFVTQAEVYSQPTIAEDGTLLFSDYWANFYAIGPGNQLEEHTASGHVKDGGGTGLAGVTVTISGEEPVITDGNGFWSKSGLVDGPYLVYPSLNGYSFSPVFNVATVNGGNVVVTDFTGAAINAPVWPVLGLNRAHTRLSPHTGPAGPALKWSISFHNENTCAEPTIGGDGAVYVQGKTIGLHVINPDGTQRWNTANMSISEITPALLPDGSVCTSCVFGVIYNILSDGSFKWSYGTGYNGGSPVIAADGGIVLTTQNARIFALYPDGAEKWSYSAVGGHTEFATPAIAADGDIYLGATLSDQSWRVIALNPDGSEKWALPVDSGYTNSGDGSYSPAIGADGTVYIGVGKYMYALYPDSSQRWAYDTGHLVHSSPAIAADGSIYFTTILVDQADTNGDKLVALHADGTLNWKYDADGKQFSSPPTVDAAGTIYAGAGGYNEMGGVRAVNPDGSLKWSYDTMFDIGGIAIGADGTLYFGDRNGEVYALGPGAG
jgi:outer membrane protein assembly factor BamB